jgi:predicted RNase H-like HicB family nuclease
MQFTVIIEEGDNGWLVGQLEEIPEVLSQGRDRDELMANLRDALLLLFESNKELMDSEHAGRQVERALLKVA